VAGAGVRDILIEGPWRHRDIAANGIRFHVAVGLTHHPDKTLVLLLHGFGEFWWAWRHQLPPVARAGYRSVAMDLRGYGASDKTPRGYDPLTLAGDVAGVIRSLGSRDAVLVGHGWGAYVAWGVAASHPAHVSALCAVGGAHPAVLTRPPFGRETLVAARHILGMQVPWLPERRIMRGDYVARHLAAWSGPDSGFPPPFVATRYREALAQWPSPHCALEYHRWLFRSRLRADGRAFAAVARRRLDVAVLQVNGALDPVVRRADVGAAARYAGGPLDDAVIAGAGHFPHEEAPEAFTETLLGWLSGRAGSGADGLA
jgi:pimeloyl-ACP methyl ester carboxylesterase